MFEPNKKQHTKRLQYYADNQNYEFYIVMLGYTLSQKMTVMVKLFNTDIAIFAMFL